MDSVEIPAKRRRFSGPLVGGSDEECAEENIEGQAVVHLDANILHRIKQEPVDYDEAPELTCVTCEQEFSGSSFKEKYIPPDEGNVLLTEADGNQGNESPSLPRVDQETLGGESIVSCAAVPCEAVSSVTDSSGLRRSSRQRFSVQRLSPQRKDQDKESSSSQRQNPRRTLSSVQRRYTSSTTQGVFPNQMSFEGRSGEIQTNDIINNESDLFKRRFRKMLKDLVAKRMLQLQHSAVYSGTVSALRRKVVILERRNMQLEDKAERLQTDVMNLYSERENRRAKTVSRGTQVSMGMILSRAWSARNGADDPSAITPEGKEPSWDSVDGPVIVKVCGQSVNDASSHVQSAQNLPTVCNNTPQQPALSSQSTQNIQAGGSLPKIQHVVSGNSSVVRGPYQNPPVPCPETFILPEHRFLGYRLNVMPRRLLASSIRMQTSGTVNLPTNSGEASKVGMQGQLSGEKVFSPGSVPVYIQQNGNGTVHPIATVRPQQAITSTAAIIPVNQHAVQQTVQVPQPVHIQPAPAKNPPSIVAEHSTPLAHHASPNVPTNAENDQQKAQNEPTQIQSGNVFASSVQRNIRGDSEGAFQAQTPVINTQSFQEGLVQTKDGDTAEDNTLPTNIRKIIEKHYRIRGFHELLPDSYPYVKHDYRNVASSGASWGDSSASRQKQHSRAEGRTAFQPSQEVPVTRVRRPPVGCPCCPPDSNQENTSGNQTSEKPRAYQRQQSHSQLVQSNGQAMASVNATTTSVQGVSPQATSVPSSAVSQQQCIPITQPTSVSQGSIPTAASANQAASSDPNNRYRHNASEAPTNVPRSDQPSQTGNTIPPPTQAMPHQAVVHASQEPMRKSIDQPVSIGRQQESRRPPDQMSQERLYQQPPAINSQMYYLPNEQIVAPGTRRYFPQLHGQQQQTLPPQRSLQQQQQQIQQTPPPQYQHQLVQQKQQHQRQLQPQPQQALPQHYQKQQQIEQQQRQQQPSHQYHLFTQQQQVQQQQHQPPPQQQHLLTQQRQQQQQPQALPQQTRALPQQYQQQPHRPPAPQQYQQQRQRQPYQQQPQGQQHYQQQQHYPQQYRLQQQPQQLPYPPWVAYYQQRVDHLQPPKAPNQGHPSTIYPKPHPSTQPNWQHNHQFLTPSESVSPGQGVRFSSVANTSGNHIVQAPPIQVQGPSQSVKDGSQFHQHVQPQVHQSQQNVQMTSVPVRQLHLYHNQLPDILPNGTHPSQNAAAVRDSSLPNQRPNKRTIEVPCTNTLFTPSMPSETQLTNAVLAVYSSLSATENEQVAVRRTSLTNNPGTAVSVQSRPASLSNDQAKTLQPANALTASPAQLRSEHVHDFKLKEEEKLTSTKDTCLVSTVPQEANGGSESLPVEPLSENRLTQEDKPETPTGTISSSAKQDYAEGSNSSSIKPVLTVEQSEDGIILSWDLTSREGESDVVKYELFVMSVPMESEALTEWESLGVVEALALPMACTMTQFLPGASYHFAVRAITASGNCELFSDPCSITVNEPA